MKVTITFEDKQPKIELSFTQAETTKVAPVVNRLLDEGPEVAAEMVPAILTATAGWMQENPVLVEKVLVQLADGTLGALADAKIKAQQKVVLAAMALNPEILSALGQKLAGGGMGLR